MEKLIEGYSQGYTRALMRVKNTLTQEMYQDMKRHGKKLSIKSLQELLDCMIEDRETLRENPFAFVRCNNEAKNGFEVFVPKGKEV